MNQSTRSLLHVFSGALIFTAAVTVSACSDAGRSPVAPTAALATASGPSHATTGSHGPTAMLGTPSDSSAPQSAGTSHGTGTEQAAYSGTICDLVLPGTPSQTSETFAIWNLGHAILDAPFDTSRPDLYGILPGTMHQEPGHPSFDHDHVASHAPGDPEYDGTWDVWVVVPGHNFDPVTYRAPRSVDAMFTLIRSGVLAGPVGMAAAGFGNDLVIHAPLVCR
jgi:hypothetical protein